MKNTRPAGVIAVPLSKEELEDLQYAASIIETSPGLAIGSLWAASREDFLSFADVPRGRRTGGVLHDRGECMSVIGRHSDERRHMAPKPGALEIALRVRKREARHIRSLAEIARTDPAEVVGVLLGMTTPTAIEHPEAFSRFLAKAVRRSS